MFVSIGGRRMYLRRAVDQNGEVLDVLVQGKRNKQAARRLLRKLLKKHALAPKTIVTDKLQSYSAAIRELGLTETHHQAKWKNNRIEGSHVPIRLCERKMRGFRTPGSAQRFLSIHAVLYNHFNTRRHLIPASDNRELRTHAFKAWDEVVGAAA
jgi:transposase-like protein